MEEPPTPVHIVNSRNADANSSCVLFMESNQYFQNYCDIVQILLDIIEILLDIARYAIVISWVDWS